MTLMLQWLRSLPARKRFGMSRKSCRGLLLSCPAHPHALGAPPGGGAQTQACGTEGDMGSLTGISVYVDCVWAVEVEA